MSESATRVIAVEERTLKFDLRTNGGCDRASIRENVANHPSKRPVREASRKTLSTGRRGQRDLDSFVSRVLRVPGSTTWKRARRCVMDDDVLARRLQGLAVHSTHGSCRGHAPHLPSQGRTGRSNFQEARLAMVSARHGWRRGGDYRLSLRVMTWRLRESLTAHGTPRSAASPAVPGPPEGWGPRLGYCRLSRPRQWPPRPASDVSGLFPGQRAARAAAAQPGRLRAPVPPWQADWDWKTATVCNSNSSRALWRATVAFGGRSRLGA